LSATTDFIPYNHIAFAQAVILGLTQSSRRSFSIVNPITTAKGIMVVVLPVGDKSVKSCATKENIIKIINKLNSTQRNATQRNATKLCSMIREEKKCKKKRVRTAQILQF
jgi:hypothetical protein